MYSRDVSRVNFTTELFCHWKTGKPGNVWEFNLDWEYQKVSEFCQNICENYKTYVYKYFDIRIKKIKFIFLLFFWLQQFFFSG